MKHKTAANFSRIALEDSPIGILQRERELNESTNIIATNHSDKNFTHKAIDSDANGIVSSHHDNTPTNKVDLIQKAVELPNQPLNQSVHQVRCWLAFFFLFLFCFCRLIIHLSLCGPNLLVLINKASMNGSYITAFVPRAIFLWKYFTRLDLHGFSTRLK